MKTVQLLVLIALSSLCLQAPAKAQSVPPPPPLALNAFLTEPMRKWLHNFRDTVRSEWSKVPDVVNVSCTYEPDKTSKTDRVEILNSSCQLKKVDKRAMDLVTKAIRGLPPTDNSLDGTDIIIRFGEYPYLTIEVWNGDHWVQLN